LETLPAGSIQIIRNNGPINNRSVPHSISKYELYCRQLIGGGEATNIKKDFKWVRVGGNFLDAIRVLNETKRQPGRLLRSFFPSVRAAADILQFPSNLIIDNDPPLCRPKHFNEEATGGPSLRAFGIARKTGLGDLLATAAADVLQRSAEQFHGRRVVPVLWRLSSRTKLRERKDALERFLSGKSQARAVLSADALEQFIGQPIYRKISPFFLQCSKDPHHPFANLINKVSNDWNNLYDAYKDCAMIIETDWKRFDTNRPNDDVLFAFEVILSSFNWYGLEGYYNYFYNHFSIIANQKFFVEDNGSIFMYDGGVPSGMLFTSMVDTILTSLYWHITNREIIPNNPTVTSVGGDDSLNGLERPVSEETTTKMWEFMNKNFNAQIPFDEWFVHRPPFCTHWEQATFPEGTDLSLGTRDLLKEAVWVPFKGEFPEIDDAAGKSHRTRLVCGKKPKFLGCYWTAEGNPIRPADEIHRIQLHPESVQKHSHEYMSSCLAALVENCYNHNCVNHIVHRLIVLHQIAASYPFNRRLDLLVELCSIKGEEFSPMMFPAIAPHRRTNGLFRLTDDPECCRIVDKVRSFQGKIMAMHTRNSEGEFESWRINQCLKTSSRRNLEYLGIFSPDELRLIADMYPEKTYRPTPSKQAKARLVRESVAMSFAEYHEFLLNSLNDPDNSNCDIFAARVSDITLRNAPRLKEDLDAGRDERRSEERGLQQHINNLCLF